MIALGEGSTKVVECCLHKTTCTTLTTTVMGPQSPSVCGQPACVVHLTTECYPKQVHLAGQQPLATALTKAIYIGVGFSGCFVDVQLFWPGEVDHL